MVNDIYGSNRPGETVSHYYGDIVRDFLLGGAVVMLLSAPFYADNLRAEFPFEVIAALIFVGLAAMTNPWKKSIIAADAIAAGIVTVVYQIWALNGYGTASNTAFVFREAVSIVSIFAFYFSVKTLRAMVLHQIGKRPSPDEFTDGASKKNKTEPDDDPISKMRHAFDKSPVEPEDDTPPHRPTFYERGGD